MEIREVIEKIEQEKYDFSKPWTSLDSSDYKEGYNDASDDILIIVKQIDEPQKVKVPECVGKDLDVFTKARLKEDLVKDICLAAYDYSQGTPFDTATVNWCRKGSNLRTMIDAIWNGYEVEEEPKYKVKLKFGRQYLSKNADGTALDFYARMHPIPSFSKSELSEIEDGAFYKADGDKEWINPIIELVPVEKV